MQVILSIYKCSKARKFEPAENVQMESLISLPNQLQHNQYVWLWPFTKDLTGFN